MDAFVGAAADKGSVPFFLLYSDSPSKQVATSCPPVLQSEDVPRSLVDKNNYSAGDADKDEVSAPLPIADQGGGPSVFRF